MSALVSWYSEREDKEFKKKNHVFMPVFKFVRSLQSHGGKIIHSETFFFILQPPVAIFKDILACRACVFSSPVLYAVGIAEKGSPCARRLGVATETTGVVRV